MHLIGFLAALALSLSSIPLVIDAVKSKHVNLPLSFILICLFGFWGMFLNSVLYSPGIHTYNFGFNTVVFIILLGLHHKYNGRPHD